MSGRVRRGAAVAGAVALLVGGYGVLDVFDLAPGVLTRDMRAQAPVPPAAADPDETPAPATSAPAPLPAADEDARRPRPQKLAQALKGPLSDPALGPSVAVDVRDGRTGDPLFASGQDTPRTPASTAKLLTAAAVTRAVDRGARFTTRAVRGASASDVVLVAGGDTLLAPGAGSPSAVAGHAGLADLARETAASLKRRRVTQVRVRLDDSYAKGPAVAPGWEQADVALGLTGPVTMLGLTDSRAVPGRAAPADPPLVATSAFAAALTRQGITVVGRPTRVRAPAGAAVLGEVESAPRSEILALALDESDNALTEIQARAAAADDGLRDLSFPAVAAWVEKGLAASRIDTSRVALHDASGLTRSTRVPASTVADVLTLASTGAAPELQDVVARLPVAALTGTLADRFSAPQAKPGVGVARAKTGTLTGVNAIAGTVVDRDGRLLVYAVLADRTGGTPQARAALDRVVATLATCGCR